MTERTFSIHDVCAAVGITSVCVHQWIERGHFVPLRETRKGVQRDYTLRDIVHLAAIAELGKAGLRAGRAAQILGASSQNTAGHATVVVQRGHTEIRLNLTAVTERVRAALI